MTDIRPGDYVTAERTVGWATSQPRTVTVSGVAALDDEGVLRVEGVPLTKDAEGYFPKGVLVVSVRPWQPRDRQRVRVLAADHRGETGVVLVVGLGAVDVQLDGRVGYYTYRNIDLEPQES